MISTILLAATSNNGVGAVNIGDQYAFGKTSNGSGPLYLGDAISTLVPIAFSIAALMVVFYFLIGAYEMILSHGDKNEIASARNKITHSIVGFILLIFLFLVLEFLPGFLGISNVLFK